MAVDRGTGLSLEAVLAERLRRQRLTAPMEEGEDYAGLFRLLQPVSPIYFSYPGSPPSLYPRTSYGDAGAAEALRSRRAILKGRFLSGSIGYVLADDLATYANAFRRPLTAVNETHRAVLDALERSGPLTPRQLKEETGLLNKRIMPALHRLQQAFLVFEDQLDTDWQRGWYVFASEWPDVELSDGAADPAAARVLATFFEAQVFATFAELKDWSGLAARRLEGVLRQMVEDGAIVPAEVAGLGEGWMPAGADCPAGGRPERSVLVLHRADILVRSHASQLKKTFAGKEVLQYLLIDGRFRGAVVGHWRIGPHDVADIVLTLPVPERKRRMREILGVVGRLYRPPRSRILKYAGKRLK